MQITQPMPAFNGVAAGSTATLNMPLGLTYHQLILTRGGTTFTHDQMEAIRLKANGRTIQEYSGADLDDMQEHDGIAVGGANLSVIRLDRPGLKVPGQQAFTAIGTGLPFNSDPNSPAFNPTPILTLTLEIDIAAGASAPTLSAKAVQSAGAPLGAILKTRKFTFAPSAAGVFEIADLPKGDPLNRVFFKTTQTINSIRLERDNFEVFNRTPAENNLIQSDGVKTNVTNLFVVDPTENGVGSDPIRTRSNDFRFKVDLAGSATLTVYAQYLGNLDGN